MLLSKLAATLGLLVALSGTAQCCLQIKGSAHQTAFSSEVDFVVIDNGLQVCTWDGGGQGTAPCLFNYHMHFDYDDNPREGPMPMTYHSPTDGPFELRVPLSCSITGFCCPSSAPCTCADCTFDAFFFC